MADPRFPRGAIPSPRHALLAAEPYRPSLAPPDRKAYIPGKLDPWGNRQYGDCVTAEEAFAKATHNPEVFIEEQAVIDWARSHGFLNGAMLNEVLDAMERDGFKVGAQQYNNGPKLAVDYSSETVLQAALSDPTVIGPVKIAIAADSLPSTAGNQQGWYVFGRHDSRNTDHCVSVAGYGPTDWLFQQLGATKPADAPPTGYLLFTWGTIGVVDHPWLMSTCVEAWVRKPTTVGVPPLPPGPTPGPTPGPGPIPSILCNVAHALVHLACPDVQNVLLCRWVHGLIHKICPNLGNQCPGCGAKGHY